MAETEKDLMDAQELLAGGEFDKAVAKYNKIIKTDPKCAEAYFGKAEASVGVPKLPPEDVMESYKKAVELDPKNPIYQSSYGAFLVEIGRCKEAGAAHPKARGGDP